MSTLKGCIKTGAVVHFPNYGAIVAADIYRVGTALIIRTNPNKMGDRYAQIHDRFDMEVSSVVSGEEFWREDLGVFVVPEESVLYFVDAPWTKS